MILLFFGKITGLCYNKIVVDRMKELTRLSYLLQDGVDKLNHKTVLVLGLGGVGGYVVEALVRSGIGHIILVDYDQVDITNINRQLIATQNTIGLKKTDAWEERIHEIMPTCKVIKITDKITEENIDMLFTNTVDFVIDACDTISVKCLLIKKCLEKHILFISSMGTANKLDPTKLEIIDIRKTSYDPIAKIIRNYVKRERLKGRVPVVCSKESPMKLDGKLGTIVTVPAVCGFLLAHYTLKQLLEENTYDL